MDLSDAFKGNATSVHRGITLPHRKSVLIQDKITGLKENATVRWNMTTAANITLSANGRNALLSKDDKFMTVCLLSPAGARFSIQSAAPKDKALDQDPNIGYRRLLVDFSTRWGGDALIRIHFNPGNTVGDDILLVPLKDWEKNEAPPEAMP